MITSIKVKFRPSTVDGKEGGLYFQIIHNRVVRQLILIIRSLQMNGMQSQRVLS